MIISSRLSFSVFHCFERMKNVSTHSFNFFLPPNSIDSLLLYFILNFLSFFLGTQIQVSEGEIANCAIVKLLACLRNLLESYFTKPQVDFVSIKQQQVSL